MMKLKYAIGRLARWLGHPKQFSRKFDNGLMLLLAAGWVAFFVFALSAGIKSEAKYDNTLGEPFYLAEQTQDAGKIAEYLTEGIEGAKSAGLTTGNAVTVSQPRPSNDTAVFTSSLGTLIARAREVDALDHSTEAYQLGLKDVKDRVSTTDTGLYFRRWTRLEGFWGATNRSVGWAIWHSILLLVAGIVFDLLLFSLVSTLQEKAYDWDDGTRTA